MLVQLGCGLLMRYNVTKRTLGGCEHQRREEQEEGMTTNFPPLSLRPALELSGRCQTGAASKQAPQCCKKSAQAPGSPLPERNLPCSASRLRMRHGTPFLREVDPCSAVKSAQAVGGPLPCRTVSWSPPLPSHHPFQVIDARCGLRDEVLQNGGPRRPFSRYKCATNVLCYCSIT